MHIQKLLRNRIIGSGNLNQSLNLKPNQIVRGAILKILPNNQALIQLGSGQRLAQLEVPLSIGEHYHFQVKENERVLHLKVLGERITEQSEQNIQHLLKDLNAPTNRRMVSLVKSLMKERIPFNRRDLIQLAPILEQYHPKDQQTLSTIRHMLLRQLPLQPNIFSALYTLQTEQFTPLLTNILNALQTSEASYPLDQQLAQQIKTLLNPEHENNLFNSQLILTTTRVPNLLSILQIFNLLDMTITPKMLEREFDNQRIPLEKSAQIRQLLNYFHLNKEHILKSIQTLMHKWEKELSVTLRQKVPLSNEQFIQLRENLFERLKPFVPRQSLKGFIQQVQNNIPSLQKVQDLLIFLSNENNYDHISKLLQREGSLKASFLNTIQRVISLTGMQDEWLIHHGQTENKTATLKQLLLSILGGGRSSLSHEQTQQLLHFINGLQLQSVEETSHSLYLSLMLPGEKLRLNQDLHLKFEGQKKNGQIDPNFCRILFYLDLKSLKETIIDMNIQNRIVNITVYNDHRFIKKPIKPLEERLKEQLKDLDFQLTSIRFKPLLEKEQNNDPSLTSKGALSTKGVDFRI